MAIPIRAYSKFPLKTLKIPGMSKTRKTPGNSEFPEKAVSFPGETELRPFRRRLMRWFDIHRREMPWREQRDPYAVWISEIMLQQTTTQAVRGYFDRFLARFPTVFDLAAAELSEVNRIWEGLGYYRRAAQLHRAARVIVEDYSGTFPEGFDQVLALPGIGRYTAGAVLSIVHDCRLPILEANTIRLHARLLAYSGETASGAGQRILWEFAERILPHRDRIGEFNLALMDLGSLVCKPRQPDCKHCPGLALCRSAAVGLQENIPVVSKAPAVEQRSVLAVFVKRREKILLVQHPPGARWAGLWDFPKVEIPQRIEESTRFSDEPATRDAVFREAERHLASLSGCKLCIGKHLLTHRHTVTRFRFTVDVYEAKDQGNTAHSDADRLVVRWVNATEIAEMPLNAPARKIVSLLLRKK